MTQLISEERRRMVSEGEIRGNIKEDADLRSQRLNSLIAEMAALYLGWLRDNLPQQD